MRCTKFKKILTGFVLLIILTGGTGKSYARWEVLVSEFNRREEAEDLLKKLNRANVNTRLENGRKYRIYTGAFEKQSEAFKKLQKIQSKVDLPGKTILTVGPKIKKIPSFEKNYYINDIDSERSLPQRKLEFQVLEKALNLLGTDYIYGGTTSKIGLDCSGFVKKVFNSIEINLPRQVKKQVNRGEKISTDRLRVGDLLFLIQKPVLLTMWGFIWDRMSLFMQLKKPGE